MAGQPSEREQTSEWIKRRNISVQVAAAAERKGRQAWADSTRTGENLDAPQPGDVRAIGARVPVQTASAAADQNSVSSPLDAAKDAFRKFQDGPPIPAPSTIESFIPVVGPAWEAASDLQRGHYGAAAFNGALAVSDLFLAGEVAKGLAKGGVFVAKNARTIPYEWAAASKWLGKKGFIKAGEEGHHWFIPQNQWGKKFPEWLKNQPWNIMSLDKVTHGRLRHRMGDLPRFNLAQRYQYGTPAWFKAAAASAAGHPAAALQVQSDVRR